MSADKDPAEGDGSAASAHACRYCRTELLPGARYCTTCKQHQSLWWRLVTGLDIKSLVALVPIATLAFVYVKDELLPHSSEVRVHPVDCTRAEVELVATNVGDRTAVLVSSVLQGHDGAGPFGSPIRLVPRGESEPRPDITPEDSPVRLRLAGAGAGGAAVRLPASSGEACRYVVRLDLLHFDQQVETVETGCPCPS